ncbi:hypothetical protein BBP40_005813 [Aspergillus hancockii]|nr:hypothetical protein BBP40_005813 [Aspergillus hancockii]
MGDTWAYWFQPHVFTGLQRRNTPVVCLNATSAEEQQTASPTATDNVLDVDDAGGRNVKPHPFDAVSALRSNPHYLAVANLSSMASEAAAYSALPPDQASFFEVLHANSLVRFDPDLVIDKPQSEKIVALASSQLPSSFTLQCEGDMPVSMGFTGGVREDDQQLLMFLSKADAEVHSQDTMEALVTFHPLGMSIDRLRNNTWSNDPFARGVRGARPGPCFMERFPEAI